MYDYFSILSTLILFTSFLLIANKKTKSYIETFRWQSILITITIGVMGFHNFQSQGDYDVLLLCFMTLALKVIYIPNLLNKTYANVEYQVEKDFFYNIPLLVLICCVLVVFTYFSLSSIDGMNQGPINTQMVNAISVILIGLFFMITRKKAIGQIVGLLVIENGLFVSALFATNGMPLIVDIGTFIDLITAVLVMGIMVFKINEEFESIDTNKLQNLRG